MNRTSVNRASGFLKLPFLFLGIFLLYAVSFLGAQSETSNAQDHITGISISGLKRTRLSTAERPLQKFIGLAADQVEADEVRAAILTTGVLEPLSVKIEGQTLVVEVREKWAIFPVPVVFAGSGGIMAGVAFFDANAFGLADKFFLAGIYQSNSWAVSSGYIHVSPGGHVPGWNLMGTYSRGTQHNSDQNNNDLRRFDFDVISLNAGLNVPLLEHSDLLNASTQVSFNDTSLRNTGKALNGPDSGLRLLGAGEDISIRKNNWDGYLLSQKTASLRYVFNMPLSGSPSPFQSIRFQGAWQKSLIPGFRINLQTGLLFNPDAPILAESPPFVAQVAILPREFSAKSYAGGSAGLEKYILKTPIGTLSASAAYQLVVSRGSILGTSFDHGVLGMLTFYLNRLAIPALGLGLAYNVANNYLQGSFALGMSF